MVEKVPCKKCSTLILPSTAQRTGGLCMSCKNEFNRCILSKDAIDIEIRMARGITTSIKNSLVLIESHRDDGRWIKAKKKANSIHKETQELITTLRQAEDVENTNPEIQKLHILLDYILKQMIVNSNEAAYYSKVNMKLILRMVMTLVFFCLVAVALYHLSIWLILIPVVLFFVVVVYDAGITSFIYDKSPFDKKRSELADATMVKIRESNCPVIYTKVRDFLVCDLPSK